MYLFSYLFVLLMPGFETSENISERSASRIVCLISESIEAFWHFKQN